MSDQPQDLLHAQWVKLEDYRALEARCQQAEQRIPKCSRCGKPAACLGSYESPDNPYEYACDECCGHGNEDGHCEQLDRIPAFVTKSHEQTRSLDEEIDRLTQRAAQAEQVAQRVAQALNDLGTTTSYHGLKCFCGLLSEHSARCVAARTALAAERELAALRASRQEPTS